MASRVSIVHQADIERGVREALGLLEGLEELFAGRHVAVKPNDTWASPVDLTACTQADTLRAVLRFIRERRPKRFTVTGGSGDGETDRIFRLLGLDRVIREEGVEFFDHNRPPFQAVELAHGPQREVMVNPRVLEYDTLVSLAQHKVHQTATVTLTMKNIAMSYPAADYYGHPRNHRLHPHRFFQDMQGFIAGMCRRFPIDLGIIAGHPAMTGRGPIGGHTFESGLVLAGRDFVAVDAAGALLLGFDRVEHIRQADRLGLGTAKLDRLEIAGLPLQEAAEVFRRAREGSRPGGGESAG
jgi:uncharacterized protein (DUF362 family)